MSETAYIFIFLFIPFFIFLWWKLFTKAGYEGWQGILMIIPVVNFIVFLYYVFAEWPIIKRVMDLENKIKSNAKDSAIYVIDADVHDISNSSSIAHTSQQMQSHPCPNISHDQISSSKNESPKQERVSPEIRYTLYIVLILMILLFLASLLTKQ